VLGVSACFGRLKGWSASAKSWSHWALSDVGVVVGKGGDGEGK
jgi:hypothetical protein